MQGLLQCALPMRISQLLKAMDLFDQFCIPYLRLDARAFARVLPMRRSQILKAMDVFHQTCITWLPLDARAFARALPMRRSQILKAMDVFHQTCITWLPLNARAFARALPMRRSQILKAMDVFDQTGFPYLPLGARAFAHARYPCADPSYSRKWSCFIRLALHGCHLMQGLLHTRVTHAQIPAFLNGWAGWQTWDSRRLHFEKSWGRTYTGVWVYLDVQIQVCGCTWVSIYRCVGEHGCSSGNHGDGCCSGNHGGALREVGEHGCSSGSGNGDALREVGEHRCSSGNHGDGHIQVRGFT